MHKKRAIILLIFSIIFLAGFSYCDKVKNPRINSSNLIGSNYVEKTNDAVSNIKKVLLEDYTGHTCGNCPKAAAKAEDLMAQYADTLIEMAVHVGSFAEPTPIYTDDYRTTAGTDWDNFFGISAAGLPKGMINRSGYPNNNIYSYTQWASVVPPLIRSAPKIIIKIKTQYDTTHRVLNVLHQFYCKQSFSNDLYFNTVLIEDSIIGKQKDYSQNPDEVDNYVFRNMLRASLNGSWGNLLKAAPININDSISKNINGYYISPNFKDKRLYVISFVYDNSTKEVIQAEKVKIR